MLKQCLIMLYNVVLFNVPMVLQRTHSYILYICNCNFRSLLKPGRANIYRAMLRYKGILVILGSISPISNSTVLSYMVMIEHWYINSPWWVFRWISSESPAVSKAHPCHNLVEKYLTRLASMAVLAWTKVSFLFRTYLNWDQIYNVFVTDAIISTIWIASNLSLVTQLTICDLHF